MDIERKLLKAIGINWRNLLQFLTTYFYFAKIVVILSHKIVQGIKIQKIYRGVFLLTYILIVFIIKIVKNKGENYGRKLQNASYWG